MSGVSFKYGMYLSTVMGTCGKNGETHARRYQMFATQAGLDPRWWPHASKCFCHMNNVQKKDG
eukprot:5390857-Amphidinium_carterae.1